MANVHRHLMALFTTGLLIVPGLARADMGRVSREPPKSSGGTKQGYAVHPTIRLDSLEVTLKLKKTYYVVYITLHFFNTGEATTQPVHLKPCTSNSVLADHDYWVGRIDSWVNGRKVERPEDSPCMLHPVAFAGHERTTIHVRREARYGRGFNRNEHREELYASYPLGAFGIWSLIGRCVFKVDGSEVGGKEYFSPELVIHARPVKNAAHDVPYRACENKNVVRYEIRDYWPFSIDRFEAYIRR